MQTTNSSPSSEREVRTLFSISFLARSISIIIQTVSPIVLVSIIKEPVETIGWVIAGFWIANAIGALVASGVIRSRSRSTLIGFIILSIAFLGLTILRNPTAYEVLVIFSGLGLAILQAFIVPSMYSTGNKERPHIGIANYSMALSLGMIAGPLAASAAIWLYGFSTLFGILTGISAAMFVVCLGLRFQRSFEGEDLASAVKPSRILKTLRNKRFGNYYAINFLYSMLLPLFISYGGIYAEMKFGIGTTEVLALFAVVFAISTAMRSIFTRSRVSQFRLLLVLGFLFLLVSFALIGTSTSFVMFLSGFLLFAVPHALIYPTTTFLALEAGGNDSIISSTYIFATSSGIAEFFAPLIAVPIIALYSLSSLFLVMAPLAFFAMIFVVTLGSRNMPLSVAKPSRVDKP
jgi:hypothetical protein